MVCWQWCVDEECKVTPANAQLYYPAQLVVLRAYLLRAMPSVVLPTLRHEVSHGYVEVEVWWSVVECVEITVVDCGGEC